MSNTKLWMGILVIVLVFGMSVVGCDDDSKSGSKRGVDSALNGTWVSYSGTQESAEIRFNNGSYDNFASFITNGILSGLIPESRGTYTTSGGKINFEASQNYGGFYAEMSFNPYGFESRWYSRIEYLNKLKQYWVPQHMTEEEFNAYYVNPTYVTTYSVNGNVLTFTYTRISDGNITTSTYIKR